MACLHILQIAAAVDIVVAWPRTRVHLEIQTVGMRIISADVVQARPQLEGSFESSSSVCVNCPRVTNGPK